MKLSPKKKIDEKKIPKTKEYCDKIILLRKKNNNKERLATIRNFAPKKNSDLHP
jgi:hypothetical protein